MLTPKTNLLADMLTKASFTRNEWNHLLRLFNIMGFSMFSFSHFSNFLTDPIGEQSAMSKRGQEATSSEGSPMAKPKPMLPAKARPFKDKVNILVQGDLYGPPKTQKSNVLKWSNRKMLKIQIPGNRVTREGLRTRLVQTDPYGQRLQEQSFKT